MYRVAKSTVRSQNCEEPEPPARSMARTKVPERPASPPRMSPPVSSPDEERLYRAIQNDAPGWQREIYDQYGSLIRGLLGRALGPLEEVEDLVADVFVGLFESAPNIRAAETMRSYVVSVALNTVRRELKSRKRRRLVFWADAPPDEMNRVASTDDPKAKAALKQLSRLLDELTIEERVIYILNTLEGSSIDELVKTLKLSRSTVKRRLKKAQDRLRRRVEKNPLLSDYIQNKAKCDIHDKAKCDE